MSANEETMEFSYDVEINSDLWAKFLGLCEQTGASPDEELKNCVEEYIASIKEENDF